MSTSDTTPLLAGRQNSIPDNTNPSTRRQQRNSIPNSLSTPANSTLSNNNNLPSNNQPGGRHWSEETEDIPGAGTTPGSSAASGDPNLFGHENTGAGYRRRGRHQPSDLDAERFSGQDRPTGLKRLLYGCCCFPCQRAIAVFRNKYSKTERRAIGMAVLFFFLALGFFCAFVRAREQLPASGKNGICTSRECTIVAADILRDMKPTVDPCTDFFTYTCGGFIDRGTIPDDKASTGYFDHVQQQNKEVIRAILSPDSSSDTYRTLTMGKDDATKRNLAKLQAYYGSCMDEKKIAEAGHKPLSDLVQKLMKVIPAPLSVLQDLTPASLLALQKVNKWMVMQHQEILNPNQHQPTGIQRLLTQVDDTDEDEKSMTFDRNPMRHKGQTHLDLSGDPVDQREKLPTPVDAFVPRNIAKRQLGNKNGDVDHAGPAFVKAEREQLAKAIAQLSLMSINALIEFDIDADPKQPEVNVLMMGESGLGLSSKEYYTEDKIVAVYEKTIEEMFSLIMSKDTENVYIKEADGKPVVWAEVAKNVVEFEKLLAAISSNPEDLENSEFTYNPLTLAQITDLIPSVDWSLVLEKLLATGSKVPNPIIVSSPDYLEKLNALLKESPASTLQNYFAWRQISHLAKNLGAEYNKPMQRLKAALQGVSADLVAPRWETCVDAVDQALGPMAGHYFVEQTFKGDSKEGADGLIRSLRTAFVKGLGRLDWLDKATLANATEKVELLVQKIGYSVESPDVKSSESLEEYFKDLGVDKADFFGNRMRARTWSTQFKLEQLDKPVDKARWMMSPSTVNAYYNPTGNEMVFPAGILQQPFYHVENPEYLNFGAIGVVAGHELTHAFDNEGRQYDAHGRLTDWWSNSTLQEFNAKSQCFIDQYGNFTIKDPQGRENHVNGKLTLGENLADNGG
ncbi:hypothetical protein BG004_004394 [Podila humilis]|nr:hypothetical protein BG004_004394 [Podila humilis]